MKFLLFLLQIFCLTTSVLSKSEQCKDCEFIVTVMHKEWVSNGTTQDLGKLAAFVCEQFHIEDNFVCTSIVKGYEDEVDYILGQIIFEPHQICGLLLADCGTFYDPLNATWSILIPAGQPSPLPAKPVPSGKPTLRVLHLSDIHLDTQYTPGEEAQCGEPNCCRPLQDPVEMAKKREAVKQPAAYWGTVGLCDLPEWTFVNMLQFIRSNHKDIDYVLVSGDLESHAVYEYSTEVHAAMVKNISDTIRSNLPNLPIYFAVGNHEGVPMDSFAPHYAPKQYRDDWLYNAMADSWSNWIPSDQVKEFKYRGCYMVRLLPGLRLLSINNPLGGDALNVWMLMNQTDPDGTLQWTIDQLIDAEKAGDKVHIVAHIPGGNPEALEGWALNYYKVVNRFQNTIVAQFFGHTHSDLFYMVYEDPKDYTSRPTGVVYSAPSATTYSRYQPAYRIYTIDGNYSGSTFQVIDYEEWFFNLTEINKSNQPEWKQLFSSINQEFGFSSHLPSDWNNLINRMKTDDSLFDKWYTFHMRRSQYDGMEWPCRGSCKADLLCKLRQFHHEPLLCSDIAAEIAEPIDAEEKMYRRRRGKL